MNSEKKGGRRKKKIKGIQVVGIEACINRSLFLSLLTDPFPEGLRIEA